MKKITNPIKELYKAAKCSVCKHFIAAHFERVCYTCKAFGIVCIPKDKEKVE